MKNVSLAVLIISVILLGACSSPDPAPDSATEQLSYEDQYNASIFEGCQDLEWIKEYIEINKDNLNKKIPFKVEFQLKEVAPLYLIYSKQMGTYIPQFSEYLLDSGADPNTAYDDRTLLMCAAGVDDFRNLNADFGRMLIEHGADVNLKDDSGLTAIDYAVKSGAAAITSCILQGNPDITEVTLESARECGIYNGEKYAVANMAFKAADSQGVTCSKYKTFGLAVLGRTEELIAEIKSDGGEYEDDIPFYAAAYCSPPALDYFVNQGFDLSRQDEDDNSLLWIAANTGNLGVVKYLLDKGVSLDFNDYDKLEYDPLKIAVINNHYDAVKYMLEQGAAFNIDESLGYDGGIGDLMAGEKRFAPDDSFQGAVSNGNIKMIKLLEEYGFPMNENTYYRALKIGIVFDQQEAITYILDKDADPNYADNRFADNDTLLEICARDGSVETLEILDEYGAKIKTKDSNALSYAVNAGKYENAKYLLEKGMDINAHVIYEDGSGYHEAWQFASNHGYFNIIKLLVGHGADVNDRDADMLAIYASGSIHITKYLIEKGADVNMQASGDKRTALHVAAKTHRTENARLLLEAGADPSIKDSEGRTALDIAKEAGAEDIVKMLEAEERK